MIASPAAIETLCAGCFAQGLADASSEIGGDVIEDLRTEQRERGAVRRLVLGGTAVILQAPSRAEQLVPELDGGVGSREGIEIEITGGYRRLARGRQGLETDEGAFELVAATLDGVAAGWVAVDEAHAHAVVQYQSRGADREAGVATIASIGGVGHKAEASRLATLDLTEPLVKADALEAAPIVADDGVRRAQEPTNLCRLTGTVLGMADPGGIRLGAKLVALDITHELLQSDYVGIDSAYALSEPVFDLRRAKVESVVEAIRRQITEVGLQKAQTWRGLDDSGIWFDVISWGAGWRGTAAAEQNPEHE